jgi:UDP-N-acetyl-D-glucosamine dehydrogenase
LIIEKIINRTAVIGVIGLGYVGLNLALLCGKVGFDVIGFDIDEKKIDSLRESKSYISFISEEEIANAKNLIVTTNFYLLRKCNIILICVQTPLDEVRNPDYSYLYNAMETVSQYKPEGCLVIIESTVAPGTTESIVPKLFPPDTLGIINFLGYSPERIDPGNKEFNITNTTKLVSGITSQCLELTEVFYKSLDIPTARVPSVKTAELSKLLENAYRYINIAFINEVAVICQREGISIWDVIDAASTKNYGFMAFYPGPGVGGHCVPVDSQYYVSWSENRKSSDLLKSAASINDNMALYTAGRILELIPSVKSFDFKNVLVLGVTYKKDVNDTRESPIFQVIKHLLDNNVNVEYHDPYIDIIEVNGLSFKSINLQYDKFKDYHAIILAVPHSYYEISKIIEQSSILIDLTNSTKDINSSNVYNIFK